MLIDFNKLISWEELTSIKCPLCNNNVAQTAKMSEVLWCDEDCHFIVLTFKELFDQALCYRVNSITICDIYDIFPSNGKLWLDVFSGSDRYISFHNETQIELDVLIDKVNKFMMLL